MEVLVNFLGFAAIKINHRCVKIGMEIDYKHNYILCMKYF
jgi:hypothetical protein